MEKKYIKEGWWNGKKAKKLNEIENLFKENKINIDLFDNTTVLKELREKHSPQDDASGEKWLKFDIRVIKIFISLSWKMLKPYWLLWYNVVY